MNWSVYNVSRNRLPAFRLSHRLDAVGCQSRREKIKMLRALLLTSNVNLFHSRAGFIRSERVITTESFFETR
jgi:hypothetical protein